MKKFVLIAGISCVLVTQAHVFAAQAGAAQAQHAQDTVRPHAHVHGVGELMVSVDGNILMLFLESPLDNLLGFEHMPSTDAQRAAVRAMAARLNDAGTLFVPTAAANCVSWSVKLDSPVLEPAKKTSGSGHADLDAEFVFRCQRPEALRGIDVKLFEGFSNLRQLNVQVASPQGQTGATLSPQQPGISW